LLLSARKREYKSFIVLKGDGEVAFLPDAFGSALRRPGVLVDTNLLVIAWFGKLTATPHVLSPTGLQTAFQIVARALSPAGVTP
jgi:hypothetical protein